MEATSGGHESASRSNASKLDILTNSNLDSMETDEEIASMPLEFKRKRADNDFKNQQSKKSSIQDNTVNPSSLNNATPSPIIGNFYEDIIDFSNYKDNFFVFVEGTEKNLGKIHPMVIGKLISDKFPKFQGSITQIQRSGFNKIKINFKTPSQANLFSKLNISGYKIHIPDFATCRFGLIKSVDTSFDTDYLKDNIVSNKKVLSVRRLNRRLIQDGVTKYIPRQIIIVKFLGQSLPSDVKIHSVFCKVDPYIQNVTLCSLCLRFGHSAQVCKGKPRCKKCGESHQLENCDKDFVTCIFCNGNHLCDSKDCPEFLKQRNIKKKMAFENLSFDEARKFFEKPSYAESTARNVFASNIDHSKSPILNSKKNFKFTAYIPKKVAPRPLPSNFPSVERPSLTPLQPIIQNPHCSSDLEKLITSLSSYISNLMTSSSNIPSRDSLRSILVQSPSSFNFINPTIQNASQPLQTS